MVFLESPTFAQARALREEERELLTRHTKIGATLIEVCGAWHEDVAVCARDHHERFNGRGYPEGTAGEEIPRVAQLLAYLELLRGRVADNFRFGRLYRRRRDW